MSSLRSMIRTTTAIFVIPLFVIGFIAGMVAIGIKAGIGLSNEFVTWIK